METTNRLAGTRSTDRLQLHLILPYRFEPREHPRIRNYLSRGFRIVQLQRISDREVIVTLDA